MKLVFMGTPAFAATCLERLARENHEILAVYTKPDTPKNRGMKLIPSEVKQMALELGIPVLQPTTLREEETIQQLREFSPDLIVVVAYGKLLPQAVLDIPPYGCINIHGSLLPQLRGAAPVQWAVLSGMTRTGVTAMYLSAGMDEGDMIATAETEISETESAGQLMDRLAVLGAELLCDTVKAIGEGNAQRIPQDPAKATYAPMLTRELSPVDWNRPGRMIVRQFHGLDPWPAAFATLAGTEFKLFDGVPVTLNPPVLPGKIVEQRKDGLVVSCADGGVLITCLQAQGGKRMSAADYFRGHPLA